MGKYKSLKIFFAIGIVTISIFKEYYFPILLFLLGFILYKTGWHEKLFSGVGKFLGLSREHKILVNKKKKFGKKFFGKFSDGREM